MNGAWTAGKPLFPVRKRQDATRLVLNPMACWRRRDECDGNVPLLRGRGSSDDADLDVALEI